ncbi:DUF2934 domain-containing protein [Luteimonas sp. YGD11-2]|uniref:DUF2934 domain-containing protein n=1 Tax=Luteimonas sp. YGD11-2 TaxID=2508168 RepID=UPI00100BBA1B|nr:DUF2934 domain-containing protein [Luteimonas sp. YGD11-2]
MDPDTRRARVEQLAREIWEAEGRPDGQAERHWGMAERLVDAEIAAAGQPPAPQEPSGH